MKKLYCLLYLFITCSCKQNNIVEQSLVAENDKPSVKVFFDSTFDTYKEGNHSHVFYLLKDSFKMISLNSTLFKVNFMASHSIDYTIIQDDNTKSFFVFPHERSYIKYYYPIETLSILLTDSIKPYLPPIEPMQRELVGIEQFLNQSSFLKKRMFCLEQLDTLLQFKKTYELGERVYSLLKLDSAFDEVFPKKKKFTNSEMEKIKSIKSVLRNKLEKKEALIYFASNQFLNVYEIYPRNNYHNLEDDLLNEFPSYNIKKVEIGVN